MIELITLRKRNVQYILFLLLFVLGILIPFYTREPRIKLGDNYIYCNPSAKVNLKKTYHLRIWDYNWPVKAGNKTYLQYLVGAINNFQQIYPNIKVEITLLDFFNGPTQLEQALKNNIAPDLYCSAYSIPKFNYRRQIPVGAYLKRNEKENYFPAMLNLVKHHGIICYFPRWINPGFWIGNKDLIEKAGLSVNNIQKNGWTWTDVEKITLKLGKGEYLLAGNFGSNGILPQLMANSVTTSTFKNSANLIKPDIDSVLDFLNNLKDKRSIPADFERNMIGRFLDGKTIFLVGVKPLVYNFIIDKLRVLNKGWQLVFIPVPAKDPGKECLLAENGVISVYRNKKTAGDDHLTAAVKLGEFLSSYPQSSPWKELMLIPSSKRVFDDWLKQSNNDNDLFINLMQKSIMLNNSPPCIFPDGSSSILNEFISDRITEEQAKLKLIKILQ